MAVSQPSLQEPLAARSEIFLSDIKLNTNQRLSEDSIVKGSFALLASSLVFSLASYSVILIVAGAADLAAFGRYSVVMAVLTWIELIAAHSVQASLTAEAVHGSRNSLQKIFRLHIVVSCFAALALAAGSPLWAGIFKDRTLAPLFIAAACDIIPYAVMIYYMGILDAANRHAISVRGRLVYAFGKLMFIGGLMVATQRIAPAIAGMALASLASCLYLRRSALAVIDALPAAGSAPYAPSRRMSCVAAGMQGLLWEMDLWIVQFIAPGSAVVGEFGAARNLIKVVINCAQTVSSAIVPSIVRFRSMKEAFTREREFRRIAMLLPLGIIAGVAVLVCGAAPITRILFGERFHHTPQYVAALAPMSAVLLLGIFRCSVLSITRSARSGALCMSAAAALASVLGYALGNKFGPQGTALALGIAGAALYASAAFISAASGAPAFDAQRAQNRTVQK